LHAGDGGVVSGRSGGFRNVAGIRVRRFQEMEKLMRSLLVFLVSLGLTSALGSVAFGETFNVHIAGSVIYPTELPNDFELAVAVAEPAVVGNPTNSANAQWGPIVSTIHNGASFTVRWAGPSLPALVAQPRNFAFDFTSDQSNVAVADVWWTINGQRININNDSGLTPPPRADDFTVSGIPEPGSLGLLALGTPAMLRRRRR
jgi:hypothetical protein